MEPRLIRALRLSKAGIATVQQVADRERITWSEAARRMLAYASATMPTAWKPASRKRAD